MKNVMTGQAAVAAPQTTIGVLRAEILALIVGSPLFKADEQLRANHNVHACESLATLVKWLANVSIEADARQICRRAAAELAHERQEAPQSSTDQQARNGSPATSHQLNQLKFILWQLDYPDGLRDRLLTVVVDVPITRGEAADMLDGLEQELKAQCAAEKQLVRTDWTRELGKPAWLRCAYAIQGEVLKQLPAFLYLRRKAYASHVDWYKAKPGEAYHFCLSNN